MKINVTQEHILKGERKSFTKCALALAIADCFPGDEIKVHGDGFTIMNKCEFYSLPKDALVFEIAFDGGCKVEPFEFEI